MSTVSDYFAELAGLPGRCLCSDARGETLSLDQFVAEATRRMRRAVDAGNKLMFVGNGGSATIADHMALDFSKNGGLPALSLNGGPMLTCLANDIGYEEVFAQQIGFYARLGDVLVAISSSGNSANIVRAVEAARAAGCRVVTLSGFSPDNRLRAMGDLNLYLPNGEYGFVEITHLAVCHAILDLAMGWSAEDGLWSVRRASGDAA